MKKLLVAILAMTLMASPAFAVNGGGKKKAKKKAKTEAKKQVVCDKNCDPKSCDPKDCDPKCCSFTEAQKEKCPVVSSCAVKS